MTADTFLRLASRSREKVSRLRRAGICSWWAGDHPAARKPWLRLAESASRPRRTPASSRRRVNRRHGLPVAGFPDPGHPPYGEFAWPPPKNGRKKEPSTLPSKQTVGVYEFYGPEILECPLQKPVLERGTALLGNRPARARSGRKTARSTSDRGRSGA